MTTDSGAAKVKPANIGFGRNSHQVERGQTEHQHGKFENKFSRVHISRPLSNKKNANAPELSRDARHVTFLFLKSRNGKTESLVERGMYRNFFASEKHCSNYARVRFPDAYELRVLARSTQSL